MKNESTKCSQTPKSPKVETLVTPQDMEPVVERDSEGDVTWNEVEDAVVVTNPDVNTLDRG